jgi:uncharacterized protein
MEENTPQPAPPLAEKSVPALWNAKDAWIGLGMLIIIMVLYVGAVTLLDMKETSALFMIGFEALLLLPIAIIFLWRNVSWSELGFRRFEGKLMGLGCGLLVIVYMIVIANNIIMLLLGVVTQGELIIDLLGDVDSTILFILATTIAAPITEEIFFRGFLFKGFRQTYGWKTALILSALIFSIFHAQVATLIPMFLLGGLFAYLYHRTESVYPGIILHFIINVIGTVGLLVASQMGQI